MIKLKSIVPIGMAALMAVAVPVNAWAVSPEFARTPEEWAQLRDDILEYGELAGLIREYNASVQNNQIDYNEFRRKYGESKEDVAAEYRKLADDVLDGIEDVAIEDESYAAIKASNISRESQARDYRQRADENVEDSYVIWLDYQSAEATLVSAAQTNMITYHQKQLELQKETKRRELLEATYNAVVARKNVGMATQLEVLTAQENLQNQDRLIATTESEIKNVKQKLQTMLGWKYDAQPEIRTIPQPDYGMIERINLDDDKTTAVENNYTLKGNRRKLENAGSGATKDSLENTVRDNTDKIRSSVQTAYQGLLTAKISYDRAVTEASVEAQNMAAADQKFNLGTISRLEHQEQQFALFEKQIDQQIADINFLQAIENYNWAVNGLAATQ